MRHRLIVENALLTAALCLLVPPAARGQEEPQQQQQQPPPPPQAVEVITVSATRLPVRLSELPTAARAWDGAELQRAPAVVLDDALRSSPAVGLFRRTSSRDSHPTALGLNLRGIAPSGVSRALVLVDGIPMDDPFGGWVYWDRVPLLAIEQVEVALGGGSAPYGSQALGGVLQLVTRRSMGPDLQLQALAGEDSTVRFGIAVGHAVGGGSVFASGQLFNTAGYISTAPEERGAVDTEITAASQSGRLRIDLPRGFTVNVEALHEARGNGTPLQTNETGLMGASAAWSGTSEGGDAGWSAHGFARSQLFESTFTGIAGDRDSENLVLLQRVPSKDYGAGGHGWTAWGDGSTVAFGGDLRRVKGRSKEVVVFSGATRAPGGVQGSGGVFAATDWRPDPRWTLSLGARGDVWRQTPAEGDAEGRGAEFLSPRAGLAWQPRPGLTLRGAAYRAFRAPTLNELYRQFRVGNVSTLANSELEEERLLGAEIGGSWDGNLAEPVGLRLQATFYWNRLENAIINATSSVTPSLITRRRENLGSATARGIELDARLRLATRWSIGASYAWLDSRIRESDDPAADGNRLPQVPAYRARGTLGYQTAGGWAAMMSVSGFGEQFEDDFNELRLAPAVTVDAAVEVPLIEAARLTVRAENLLDAEVEAKRTPTLGYAAPRLLYGGVTLTWPR